jgi:hypothetical protein
MQRREFIAGLGSVAASSLLWPLAARAQQPALPVVGFIVGSPDAFAPYAAAFRAGLREIGYVDGQNVSIEYHWLEGQYDRWRASVAELLHRRVSQIYTITSTRLEAQIFAVTGRAVHYWSIASKCLASRRQDSCKFLRPFGRRGQERGYGRHRYVRRPWSQVPAYDCKFHPRVGARLIVRIVQCIGQGADGAHRLVRLAPVPVETARPRLFDLPPWYPAPLQPCSSLQSR